MTKNITYELEAQINDNIERRTSNRDDKKNVSGIVSQTSISTAQVSPQMTTKDLIKNIDSHFTGKAQFQIRTTGYHTPNDTGGAWWQLVTGVTSEGTPYQDCAATGDIFIHDGLGRKWEIVLDLAVTSKCIGTVGDYNVAGKSGFDDTLYLKAYLRGVHRVGYNRFVLAKGVHQVTSILNDTTTNYDNLQFLGVNRADSVLVNNLPNTKYGTVIVQFRGRLATQKHQVTQPVQRHQFSIFIEDTTGLETGNYCVLQDATQAIKNNANGSDVSWDGEWIRIDQVISSTEIKCVGLIDLDYSINATLQKVNPASDIRIADLTFRGHEMQEGKVGVRCLSLLWLVRLNMENVMMRDCAVGCITEGVAYGMFTDCRLKDLSKNEGYGWGIRFAVWNCQWQGINSQRVRHVITSGSSGGFESAHNMVVNCISSECYGASFDTHPAGGRDWVFDSCQHHGNSSDEKGWFGQGFQVRSRYTTIINPIVTNSLGGVNFARADHGNVIGGVFRNVSWAFQIQSYPHVNILGEIILENIKDHVVLTLKDGLYLKHQRDIIIDAEIKSFGEPMGGPAFNFHEWVDSNRINVEKLTITNCTNLFGPVIPLDRIYPGTNIALGGDQKNLVIKHESFPRHEVPPTGYQIVIGGRAILSFMNLKRGTVINVIVMATLSDPVGSPSPYVERKIGIYNDQNKLLGTTTSNVDNTTGLTYFPMTTPYVTPYDGRYGFAYSSVHTTAVTTPERVATKPILPIFASQHPYLAGQLKDLGLPEDITNFSSLNDYLWICVG